jgi:glutathione S-transferase
VFGADAAAIESWCRHWAEEGLATYERLLARRPAAPFALGATPTIADICIAGQIVTAELYELDLAAFPGVATLGSAASNSRRSPTHIRSSKPATRPQLPSTIGDVLAGQ